MIFSTDTTAGFPRMTEIGIRGLFRLTVESSLSDRILRYGLTVKIGTIRHFGFDRQ